jgi:hypothetical protein
MGLLDIIATDGMMYFNTINTLRLYLKDDTDL